LGRANGALAAPKTFTAAQLRLPDLLSKRIYTTVFVMPLFLAVIFYGGLAFKLCLLLLMLVASWEVFSMAKAVHHTPSLVVSMVIIGDLFALTLKYDLNKYVQLPWVMGLTLGAMAVFMAELARRKFRVLPTPAGLGLRVTMLFGFFGVFMVLIRDQPQGLSWTLWLMAMVWTNDIAAYVVGKHYGRRPLAPNVSPKKTVEGAWGALAGSVWVSLLLGVFLLKQPWWIMLLFGFGASVVAQLGDLHESMTKRTLGVKDSGQLFPGHGGAYDRIDSFIFLTPLAYYFMSFMTGI
jgi:phosphatidate cytidylyltransferase